MLELSRQPSIGSNAIVIAKALGLLISFPDFIIKIESHRKLLPKSRCLVGSMESESCLNINKVSFKYSSNNVGAAIELVVIELITLIKQ